MWKLAAVALCSAAFAQTPDTVFLEELTWAEVRDALKAGRTTLLVPTGGTEQNGPHMVLGKHNFRIHYTANRIARQLGNALVAPVMAYVPEGGINPPEGHMNYPGTLTIPDEVFRKVLEYTARSAKLHGFKNIVFLGDSGPNQPGQKAVAEALNKEWAGSGTRVHHIGQYYSGTQFEDWLATQGETKEAIGTHAGAKDTALLLAVDPKLIRTNQLANARNPKATGVTGDPTRATLAYGRKGLDMLIETTVALIRKSIATP